MEINITDYIRPELLILVPVLIIIGAVIKHYTQADNRWIPLALTIIGMVLATLYTLSQAAVYAVWTDVLSVVLTGIVQGVLVAGAAVYGNQMYQQLSNKVKEDK